MPAEPTSHGTVIAFDRARGLGEIRADDGTVYPFHATRLSDGSRDIAVGADVIFELGPGLPGRWEAVTVERRP